MSRIAFNRLARTNVLCAADVTNITVTTPNSEIIANLVKETKDVIVEQFFRAFTANDVINDTHTTITQTNVQDSIEQLESQFSRGATDPTTETEPHLDEGDLFYNTNTNQLKVFRDGTFQILLQAGDDMDTLDGSTF
jgi:spore maturation protein CgeB